MRKFQKRPKRSRAEDNWVRDTADVLEPWQILAGAIVLQAVAEYRVLPESREEIEEFFRSEWFTVLTEIDAEKFIIELRKENDEQED